MTNDQKITVVHTKISPLFRVLGGGVAILGVFTLVRESLFGDPISISQGLPMVIITLLFAAAALYGSLPTLGFRTREYDEAERSGDVARGKEIDPLSVDDLTQGWSLKTAGFYGALIVMCAILAFVMMRISP
ncbi:MAG: hypothetical protein AAF680_12415 [Pseudomonadota bacterium]